MGLWRRILRHRRRTSNYTGTSNRISEAGAPAESTRIDVGTQTSGISTTDTGTQTSHSLKNESIRSSNDDELILWESDGPEDIDAGVVSREHDRPRVSRSDESGKSSDDVMPIEQGGSDSGETSDFYVENEYVYGKLSYPEGQIRLLTLEPANELKADIYCTPKTVLSNCSEKITDYEALSYTWGRTRKRHAIHVNGKLFGVTPNLEVALQHLRLATEPRVLWVDAVCINQNDSYEKTHQVRRMRHNYSDATRVLVWLEDADDEPTEDDELAKAMNFLAGVDLDEGRKLSFKDDVEFTAVRAGVVNLFNKTWWSRMWVVQEVFYANEPPLVGYGTTWIDWTAVDRASYALVLEAIGDPSKDFPPNMMSTVPAGKHKSSGMGKDWTTLHGALKATCDRDATNPKDKVFALLGLLEQKETEDVILDYNRTVSEVYQAAVVSILKSERSLGFLLHASSRQKKLKLPTWCVDFSVKDWYGNSDASHWENEAGALGELLKSEVIHDPQNGLLTVTGIVVGKVDHVTKSRADRTGLGSSGQSKRALYARELPDAKSRLLESTKSLIGDALGFTMAAREAYESRLGKDGALQAIADGRVWEAINGGMPFTEAAERENRDDYDWREYPQTYSQIEKWCHTYQTMPWSLLSEGWADHLPDIPGSMGFFRWGAGFLFEMSLKVVGKAFLTTDTGYIGRSWSAVKEGDVVCILSGCSLPAVLRPMGKVYELVSFVWVSETMDGELVEDKERIEFDMEEFCIR